VLSSCHREKADSVGPSYISAPDGFAVNSFSASTTTVDFTSGNVKFSGALTNAVTWIITIKGQTSGAVHQITGTSDNFSNVVWTGNHDGTEFFRAGETVTATLSFYGTTVTSSITITITNVPDYKTCGIVPLYGEFEDTAQVLNWYNGSSPHYSKYYAHFNFPTPIPNVTQGIDSVAFDYNGKIVPSVQGKKYYYMKGLGNQPQFVTGMQYYGGGFKGHLSTDPNQVWFNIYIYGTGDANAELQIDFQESDYNGAQLGYQPTEDDAYVALITLNHKGWKLFSFPYSYLSHSTDINFGGRGNNKMEPNNISSFDVVLLKKLNPNSPVEVYLDYPIFTIGGPFKPCK